VRRHTALLVVVAALLVAVSAWGDELGDAMSRADALGFFTRIGLTQAQAQQIVAPVQRIQQLVQQYEATRKQRLNALAPTLIRARQILAEGRQLPSEIESALTQYRQQSEKAWVELQRAVDQEMQRIADTLYPEQNALLDWTPPASIRRDDTLQERLRLQQIAMGRIQEAGRMLERVKYLDAFNFVTARTPIINDYLSAYFEPDTPDFETAFRICLEFTDRVRMLPEEQWRNNAWDIAADLVDRLGLMPSFDQTREGTVTWSALFKLFTNSQTLTVLQKLAQAG